MLMLNMKIELSKSEKILNKDNASFFKEEVRREIVAKFTESKLYDGGLSIMTTLDEEFQLKAEEAFKEGLRDYSNRSGWNGPIGNIKINGDWEKKFEDFKKPAGLYEDIIAIVKKVNNDRILVLTKEKKELQIFQHQMSIISKKTIVLKKRFNPGDLII